MLGQWREDKQAGREVDPQQYLDMLSRLQADASSVPSGPAAAAEDAPGSERQRVGPYELIEEIGRGGQGSVWRARDTRLNRQVALKLLSAVGSSLQFERFLREAEIASRLDHPAICAVYDTGTEDGVPYIAMRLVEGMSLAGKIRECREDKSLALPTLVMSELSEVEIDSVETSAGPESHSPSTRDELDQILGCIAGAARGLHAAHEVGIVHRDIKPAKVLVHESGGKLNDLGIADDTLDRPAAAIPTGSIGFMAPEVARGEHATPASDIFGLGATLHLLLTGTSIYASVPRDDLLSAVQHVAEIPPTLSVDDVPPLLRALMESCLQLEPADRVESAAEVGECLDEALVSELPPM